MLSALGGRGSGVGSSSTELHHDEAQLTVLGNAEGEALWADSTWKLWWKNLTPVSLQEQCEMLKQFCSV